MNLVHRELASVRQGPCFDKKTTPKPISNINIPMSSNYPVRHDCEVRRARRLGFFCREIKRALINRCLDRDITLRHLDDFIDGFFITMEYHDLEYPLESLIGMLVDEELVEHTMQRYVETT